MGWQELDGGVEGEMRVSRDSEDWGIQGQITVGIPVNSFFFSLSGASVQSHIDIQEFCV